METLEGAPQRPIWSKRMKIYKVDYGIDVSVRIDRDDENDLVAVTVLAPLYMRTEWKLACQWSTNFSDNQILKERTFVTAMVEAYCCK